MIPTERDDRSPDPSCVDHSTRRLEDISPTVTPVSTGEERTKSRSVAIEVDLTAVIVAVTDDVPRILTVSSDVGEMLPSGSLDPLDDRTLELGMRRWVREQTGIELGYLEQLYTYGDRDRFPDRDRRVLSIAYLALVREQPVVGAGSPQWRAWYDHLPWEDWRGGRPGIVEGVIMPALSRWVAEGSDSNRSERVAIAFGTGGSPWDSVRVLDRYELLYGAGCVPEARSASGRTDDLGETLGRPMALDHRRIVGSALERLRGKLSYRPVVFELLAETFTLNQLLRVVEALVGHRLHKPNFRRLVEQGQLVERTGLVDQQTGGRPAELFRFRREVLRERPAPGVGLPRRSR